MLRVLCAAAVATAVSLLAPQAAFAADVCISQAVRDAASVCPALPTAPPVTPAPAPAVAKGPPDPGSKACIDQGERVEKLRTLGDKDAIIRELDQLIDIHRKIETENHPVETKYRCANITAEILVETAMNWHLRAVGGGQETNRQNTMKLAIRVYEKILDHFTAEQIASLQYPRLSKIDWPSRWRIQYAVADLNYFLKDWAKCGPAFDAVVLSAPERRITEEAVFAAALCYHNQYE